MNPLRPVSLAGLILALVLAWALVFFTVTRNKTLFPPAGDAGSVFARELAGYDGAAQTEDTAKLDRRLDRLEKRAENQDERLSVLKRRRVLAARAPRFIQSYRESAEKAAKDFPFSQPMAAVAAEALLETTFSGNSFTAEDRALLHSYVPRLTQKRFYPLVLSIHVLSGGMDDPAGAPPNAGELFSAAFSRLSQETKNDLRINGLLLEILAGGTQGTPVLLGKFLGENPENRDLLKLSADFFYDYGMPLRAAELYSRLDSEESLALEGGALYLAGEIPAARNIWTILAASGGTGSRTEISRRSLYNLAAASENEKEVLSWLEKLFAARNPGGEGGAVESAGAASTYGIIRYTRLQGAERGAAILDDQGLTQNPLLDLELLRRRSETWPLDRRAAEVWLLLGRHPGSGELFRWGAWFFDRQKLYGETAQLLKIAARQGIDGAWVRLHQGLALARDGKSAQAEKLFQETFGSEGSGDWRFPANIARIQEGRRSVSGALENYEIAASLVKAPREAAIIQFRISRCLQALGQNAESRRALEKAQALDPENLSIRHTLRSYPD